MIVDTAYHQGRPELIHDILNGACGQNMFLTMSEQEKTTFVKDVYNKYSNHGDHIREALAQRYYAPYFLLILIERDEFRKMTDYTHYERTLDLSRYQLEELSKNPTNEELFMNFMRYITLLDTTDPKRVQGQNLISKIYELEKYK